MLESMSQQPMDLTLPSSHQYGIKASVNSGVTASRMLGPLMIDDWNVAWLTVAGRLDKLGLHL